MPEIINSTFLTHPSQRTVGGIDVNCIGCPYPEYAARVNGEVYPKEIVQMIRHCTDNEGTSELGVRLCPVAEYAIRDTFALEEK